MGGTNATAILDLEFLGNLYDVTFVDDTAFNVYGDPLARASGLRTQPPGEPPHEWR
jgi:hypothetical protein